MAIFSLNEVRTEQIKNIANDNFESWPESATYGYFGGGSNAPGSNTETTTVDRIDLFSETTSAPGHNLSQQRRDLATVSNSSYGYFGGGLRNNSVRDTIDRIDFSNETMSLPGNDLPEASSTLSGTSSNSYGYFGLGGPNSAYVKVIDRLDFSNETFSAGNDLSQIRGYAGTVSSDSYGYFGGGYNDTPPTSYDTVDRIDFSSETTSTPGNNLPQARDSMGTVSSDSYGYFGGGTNGPNSSDLSTVDRIDFSSETFSVPGNNLPESRWGLSAVSSDSYGYFGGGYSTPPPTKHTTVDRIDLSNETMSVPTAPNNNLTQGRNGLAALSGGASQRPKGSRTYGYFGGGRDPSLPSNPTNSTARIDRIDFSSETTSTPGNDLSQARGNLAAFSSNSYGYFGGGLALPPGTPTNRIDRIDLSNETSSLPTATLSQVSAPPIAPGVRCRFAAVSSSSYGYFGGGQGLDDNFGSERLNVVDRFDFSNETVSLPGNNLSEAKDDLAAVSNSSYGYFGGGERVPTTPSLDTVDRIDFSNETTSAPGNNLPQGRENLAACSSNSYGYFGGGLTPNSPSPVVTRYNTIDRIDFSNETVSPVTATLPEARSSLAACSSSSYGYFSGGIIPNPPPPVVSTTSDTIDRIDFSNETTSASGNNLPRAINGSAAVSN